MATYVIGDIQGCFDELQSLLSQINFNPQNDHLIFAGDLVNRGPKSLETLRFVKSLGPAAETVLGNHDLHLLALANGNLSHAGGGSLDAILQAEDREELLDWLRHRPMMIDLPQFSAAVIHAGLPPQWTHQQAMDCAAELENVLRDNEKSQHFFQKMYGNKPKKWRDDLSGMKRLRFITNCFTRLRYCTTKGKLRLEDKGPPGTQKAGRMPWFDVPGRKTENLRIFFGHWSTLGLTNSNNAWSLDTGCLWGGQLTTVRLDDMQVFQHHCRGEQNPTDFQ